MLSLPLEQLFGAGASQTATALTIQKSALASVGLTISPTNRAEALICALALLALRNWEGFLESDGEQLTADGKPLTYTQPREAYEKLRLFQWERKLNQGYQLDTIVIEAFVTPPTGPEIPLTPELMDYGT